MPLAKRHPQATRRPKVSQKLQLKTYRSADLIAAALAGWILQVRDLAAFDGGVDLGCVFHVIVGADST